MKIALASARFINNDINFNLGQIRRYAREAQLAGADLLCFGEAFLQGFDALNWDYVHDREIAAAVDSDVFKELRALTEETGVDLLLGFLERDGGEIYSSCALLGGGQTLHLYRRISKGWKEYWKTSGCYQEGGAPELFSYRGKRCLIALCGDLWDFPERFQLGADLLIWPVYVNFSLGEWVCQRAEYAAQAALACRHTLLVNSVTRPPDAASFGGCYEFVDGEIRSALEPGTEGLLIVEPFGCTE